MHVSGCEQPGHHAAGSQEVGHEGAAAWPQLDQPDRLGRAHQAPDLGGPEADQFAEHLADLGRGREVALRSERIAGCVIAMLGMAEAQGHVALDREWPLQGDDALDLVEEGRHADVGRASASGRVEPRAASQMATRPTTAMGKESSMPMVMPPPSASSDDPNRKPSWASGSRKNSQMMRAVA